MARFLSRPDLTLAVIVLLLAVQAVIRFAGPIAADVSWYLYAAGRLLDGAQLYEDIVEINPPLGLWLSLPVAATARTIGVNAGTLAQAVLLALTALSLGLSSRFIAGATDISDAARHFILILMAALMLFLPAADFGQREHLVILLATPWVLLRWNRLFDGEAPWMLALWVGLLAGFGLWLKAHFIFTAIALEVTILFATRDLRTVLRIENQAILAVGAAYLAAIWLIWPAATLARISFLGSRAFVPFYELGFDGLAAGLVLPLALAAVVLASASLLSERLLVLRTVLLVVAMTFVGTYVLQAGYRYQSLPAVFFLSLAAGLGLARAVAGDVAFKNPRGLISAFGAAIAILAAFAGFSPLQIAPHRGEIFERAIAREAPEARTIFIASTRRSDAFPLVLDHGLLLASRYPSQWFSPFLAAKLDADGRPDDYLARQILASVVSDLVEFQPDIVFVDEDTTRTDRRRAPLDYVAFWGNDERFRGFWKAYEKRGGVATFSVYVRRAGASGQ